MQQEIENALRVLIGQPFWKARRVVNLACFEFGQRNPSTDRKGQPIEYGDYALHIQCDWRFARADEIIVGSDDMYYPTDGSANPPDGFDWDTKMGNLFDVRMKDFIDEHAGQPLIVTSIDAGRAGSVSIYFTDDIVLDIFPAHSVSGDNEVEHWRFFHHEEKHFVIYGNGIGC
jgi:hypothetical protein